MEAQDAGNRHIFSVRELNQQANNLLQDALGPVWVEGELSNFARPASGHWYFTLKDAHAQVRCAMFRGRNYRLRERPDNGMQVLVRARAGIYEARGDYQLIVDHLEPAGRGRLEQQFEQLKQKLLDEGLFDAAHKQALPRWVRCAGIVSSASGAALHDIVTVLARRFPAMDIRLYPTAVQGKAAAEQIVTAIRRANEEAVCDVLIVGRGGGSLEDLWPFNEEIVARAIFASQIPVVSAVGHETDFSIADFVADLRAATPSAAAELISPDQDEVRAVLVASRNALRLAMQRRLESERRHLHQLGRRLRHPRSELQQRNQQLDQLDLRLRRAARQGLTLARQRLERQQARLLLQGPGPRLQQQRQRVQHLHLRLQRELRQRVDRERERLQARARSLHQISPLETLARGYAVITTGDGTLVRSTSQVRAGERVQARVADGRIDCKVEQCLNEFDTN